MLWQVWGVPLADLTEQDAGVAGSRDGAAAGPHQLDGSRG